MKRILSLTLALVMILGTFTGVFAAEEEFSAAEFLQDNGVLEGADGDLMLDKTLLRRDMVILLSRLMNAEDVAADFPSEDLTFEDITDPYYNGYLAWSVENGLIEGHDELTFGFNENVTAQDYATVLLRALEYDMSDDANWAKALEIAEELEILEGVEVENKTEITRDEMAIMTFNALKVEMLEEGITLAEFLGIKMPEDPKATELEVVEVYTENLAEVVVELSNADLVKNKEALTNPANYRLSDNTIKVQNVDIDGDDVILTLVPYGKVDEQENVNTLVKDKKYDLTIRNIDREIDKTYKGIVAIDNAIPSVEKVEFIGTHGIKVTTTEPIANPQERNFRISDKRTAMIVEQYGREIILTPYHSGSFDKDATELVIEELRDFANYKSVKTSEAMELVTDTVAPEVVEAYRSGNKLTLVFDQDIYHDSINYNESRRELGNVSFVERRVTVYSTNAEKVDSNVAVYTFEREIPKNMDILVEGVQNHSKESMEEQSVTPELYIDEYAPEVISDLSTTIRATSDEKRDEALRSKTKGLTIKFSKDIQELVDHKNDKKELDVADFFRLYELEVANRNELIIKDDKDVKVTLGKVEFDSVELIFENVDPAKLMVNNLRRDYDYVLEIKDLTDLSGNRMSREYIDFQILPAATDFNITKITVGQNDIFNRKDTEVKLEFNGYVDKASAEDATNYYINGKIVFDEAIVERDGKTVTLVKRDMTNAKFVDTYGKDADKNEQQIELEVSPRVKNLAKDAQVANRFWELRKDLDSDTAVKNAEDAVKALPKVSELTTDDIAAVNTAKDLYDGLTPAQKAIFDADLLEILNNLVEKVEELEDDLEEENKKIEAEKVKLQTAIAAAALTEEEETENTKATVDQAKSIIASAKTEAEAVDSNDKATLAEVKAAITKLNNTVEVAKGLLVEKAEATKPAAPTITTNDATEFVLAGLDASVTATVNDVDVESNTATLSEALVNGDTLTVVITVPADDNTLEGVFTFTYTVNEDTGTWSVDLD